jgi:tetratricopeptide (TPR) repeat protein
MLQLNGRGNQVTAAASVRARPASFLHVFSPALMQLQFKLSLFSVGEQAQAFFTRWATLLIDCRTTFGSRSMDDIYVGCSDGSFALNNFALVYNATGDYEEARAFNERTLAIREAALGPDHPDVATSISNIAVVLHATGSYEEAKQLNERALVGAGVCHVPEVDELLQGVGGLSGCHAEQQQGSETECIGGICIEILLQPGCGSIFGKQWCGGEQSHGEFSGVEWPEGFKACESLQQRG